MGAKVIVEGVLEMVNQSPNGTYHALFSTAFTDPGLRSVQVEITKSEFEALACEMVINRVLRVEWTELAMTVWRKGEMSVRVSRRGI